MRSIAILLSAVVAVGCSQQDRPTAGHEHGHAEVGTASHAHGEGGHAGHAAAKTKLDVRADGEPEAGVPATLRMSIQGKDGRPVKDFKEAHEAMVHLIIVRAGLDQFAHVHPKVDATSGELTVQHTFPVGGTYHMFADFQDQGGAAGLAVGELKVAGDAPAAPALVPDAPGTVAGDGLTAQISVDGVKAGAEGTVCFVLSTPDGKPASNLEPYMGAMGHLNIVSADATQSIHSHPSDGDGEKNKVTFIAHFHTAGLYKGWGQFKRNGRVQVVPFVLKVE